jgi:peptide/nickel transport system permease protein
MALILLMTFVLVRMLPGDPARLQLGPLVPQEGVDLLRKQMLLDRSWPEQFVAYVGRLLHGDFGRSWVNSSNVSDDLSQRIPATLELIGLGMLVVFLIMVPLGALTAARGGGFVPRLLKRLGWGYGLLAGALPDFWLGLILIFILSSQLHLLPGPEGRLAIGDQPPHHITGLYTVDSILTVNLPALLDSIQHLLLPVLTLAFVGGAILYKTTWTQMATALPAQYTTYLEGFGVKPWRVFLYAFRASAPPVIVMTGVLTGYLLGGAVLIETVFNLNGVGQYAVQSVISSDYAPIQAFVLIAAVFNMSVYLIVDLIYFAIDPRVRVKGSAQ